MYVIRRKTECNHNEVVNIIIFVKNVCNQFEGFKHQGDAIHTPRDYIRFTAITYQSFGLYKNKAPAIADALFLAPQVGLEPTTTTVRNIVALLR